MNDEALNMIWLKTAIYARTLSKSNVKLIVTAQIACLRQIAYFAPCPTLDDLRLWY